jgi:hypothetical protein
VAEAGLDHLHISTVSDYLPIIYTYIGNNTVRLSLNEPVFDVEWLDFVMNSLNSQEDASIPVPITSLDVTQAANFPIPQGVTQFSITFYPAFTTIPIVIPTVSVPAGQPEIQWWVTNGSINAYGFTVNLAKPLSVNGYVVSYVAATTA